MRLPDEIINDTQAALSLIETNLSPTWHASAANMLEDLAIRIRKEIEREEKSSS